MCVKVMRIATGQESEELEIERAKSAATERGSPGESADTGGRRLNGDAKSLDHMSA
jgi:hypothetical protein